MARFGVQHVLRWRGLAPAVCPRAIQERAFSETVSKMSSSPAALTRTLTIRSSYMLEFVQSVG
ncbi:hypothetical protein PUNSTDRAFT_134484 [Punctularia strigosozonata HHB-11173 SS5]|uniref:uncharacterized protein n=1 Tax=Punctularia strigosozonata (strain HHB-11173) TaxID=741275 RepID=UPI000441722D|nr:uncharacterized protein PUNSTDRAFT_134484 [Punctularia strigosozonata HHB-11173 SS5]EIN09331.1 hypothetical protein PUNSTDRAFT_134484 [Punctularia strigosozonata HHB-11173 SS5]